MKAELRPHEATITLLQQLDAVLDAIDYGVILMDAELRATIVNRSFCQMWGVSADFIRARPAMEEFVRHIQRTHQFYDVPEEEFDAYVAQRVERVQSGKSFEATMSLRDGRIIHHQIKTLPDGGRLLTYFDITRLKRSTRLWRNNPPTQLRMRTFCPTAPRATAPKYSILRMAQNLFQGIRRGYVMSDNVVRHAG